MTAIDTATAAKIIGVTESWVRKRVQPGIPKAQQVPHYRLPGSRLVRFHEEVIHSWTDDCCPPWDTWTKDPYREPAKKVASR